MDAQESLRIWREELCQRQRRQRVAEVEVV